jgi:hypothetical protein
VEGCVSWQQRMFGFLVLYLLSTFFFHKVSSVSFDPTSNQEEIRMLEARNIHATKFFSHADR